MQPQSESGLRIYPPQQLRESALDIAAPDPRLVRSEFRRMTRGASWAERGCPQGPSGFDV
jgi:hypothetical protein